MTLIRSPLGAIGAILVALEAVFGGTLFALDDSFWLRVAIVVTMIVVFVSVTAIVLWMVVYLTVKNPGFLFSPVEVAQLSESVQRNIYSMPNTDVSTDDSPSYVSGVADTPKPRPEPLADTQQEEAEQSDKG